MEERMADEITTRLKSLQKYMDVRQGKIVKLEISNAPIIRIPSTIVNEQSIAIIIL